MRLNFLGMKEYISLWIYVLVQCLRNGICLKNYILWSICLFSIFWRIRWYSGRPSIAKEQLELVVTVAARGLLLRRANSPKLWPSLRVRTSTNHWNLLYFLIWMRFLTASSFKSIRDSKSKRDYFIILEGFNLPSSSSGVPSITS